MNSISMAAPGLPSSLVAGRLAVSLRAPALLPQARDAAPDASTSVTLGNTAASDEVVYTRPKAAQEPLRVPVRLWASPQQDAISALMASNANTGAAGSLADQWRGLGGALLSRFATTDAAYGQTLADLAPPEGAEAGAVDAAQALGGVPDGAATVKLGIRTLSGQTVELTIAANLGAEEAQGPRGLQVGVSSSGPLSERERQALARLAEGFDQVLEGLGQPDRLQLDLAGLMDFDGDVLAGLDLSVRNPKADQALSSFSLHLGSDSKTVDLKGAAGELSLNLAKGLPLGPADVPQRQSAIDEHLRRFDAAAERSHADGALLALFKQAFSQLHSAPAGQADASAEALSPRLVRQLQPLHSGLEDFQASFRGDFERTNSRGAVNEKGRADYQVSQKTTVKPGGAPGELAIDQARDEKLEAQSIRSRFGGMLDTRTGNYDVHKVRDHNTSTTAIETAKGQLVRASRSTEQVQLRTLEKLVNDRVAERSGVPVRQRDMQVLFQSAPGG